MNRRQFIACAVVAASFAGLAGGQAAALTVASSPFVENDGLDDEQIIARFDSIDSKYEIGGIFSDSDVDFTLRYGLGSPNGAMGVRTNDAIVVDDLPFIAVTSLTDGEYNGDFGYTFHTVIEIENKDIKSVEVLIDHRFVAYGWVSPFQGANGMCNYGIMYRGCDGQRTVEIPPGEVRQVEIVNHPVGIVGTYRALVECAKVR